METLSLDGFLKKQEAQDQFERHRRTLTKDVRKAIVERDEELLLLLRVHTQDGKVRDGTELSVDSLKELTNEGLNPTVYLHPDFVKKVFQRNKRLSRPVKTKPNAVSAFPKQADQAHDTDKASSFNSSGELPLPEDPETRSIVLEHLHYNDRKHQEETEKHD